jgi:hypothetical protein
VSVFLEIGLLAVVVTILSGGAMMVHWAREQGEREASTRRREEVVDVMTRAAEKALDPDPATSVDGLRKLGALHDDRTLEPEDDEFLEEIANVVMSARLDTSSAEGPLVLGTVAGAEGVDNSRIVLPHELLAAMLAVDIATTQDRKPSELASRISSASPAVDPSAPAEPEPTPLKRSA